LKEEIVLTYRQYLRRNGIRSLSVATKRLHPASILCPERRGFFEEGRLDLLLGEEWSASSDDASIEVGTFTRELSLKGKVSAKNFGLNISGGLGHASSVTYEVEDVRVREFDNPNVLTNKADAIGDFLKANKGRKFRNCFLAQRLWYATKFKVRFEGMSRADVEAVFATHLEKGSLTGEMRSDGTVLVATKAFVPFGFTGKKLKEI
jgi:hypothetical protein